MLSYLCAHYRYYHPLEFITSFLNNSANDDDIRSGTVYAEKRGIRVTMPKWGVSKGEYFYDFETNTIAQGLSSIKYMGEKVANELFDIAQQNRFDYFVDLLDCSESSSIDSRQLDILIKLDFFSDFGNQRELLHIVDAFVNLFKSGNAKRVRRELIDGTPLESVVKKYAVGVTKSGGVAKSYTLLDIRSILREYETIVLSSGIEDFDDITKVKNFYDVMGYAGYVSGEEKDRRKLYVTEVKPLRRKTDNQLFGYSVFTKSIGSGKESRFTVVCGLFDKQPIKKGEIIYCKQYERNNGYFRLTSYEKIG